MDGGREKLKRCTPKTNGYRIRVKNTTFLTIGATYIVEKNCSIILVIWLNVQ